MGRQLNPMPNPDLPPSPRESDFESRWWDPMVHRQHSPNEGFVGTGTPASLPLSTASTKLEPEKLAKRVDVAREETTRATREQERKRALRRAVEDARTLYGDEKDGEFISDAYSSKATEKITDARRQSQAVTYSQEHSNASGMHSETCSSSTSPSRHNDVYVPEHSSAFEAGSRSPIFAQSLRESWLDEEEARNVDSSLEVGNIYESEDADGHWWKVKITHSNSDGSYSAIVCNPQETKWGEVWPDFVRPCEETKPRVASQRQTSGQLTMKKPMLPLWKVDWDSLPQQQFEGNSWLVV